MNDFARELVIMRIAGRSTTGLALATTLLGLACGTATSSIDVATQGAGAGAAGTTDWCAARRVLEAKCWRCHTAPPQHGAPFPLVSYEDTQLENARGVPRFSAIEKAVSDDFMPARFIMLEPPVAALSDAEKQTLLDWCAAGAPAGSAPDCDLTP